MQQHQPIKVLIVDDSPIIRQSIADIVLSDGSFEVVGMAESGREALRMVDTLQPDVISLDVVMPGMNGITTLKHLMINHPTPTVMVSSLTTEGATITFDALRYGALDFIPKPSKLTGGSLRAQSAEIVQKLTWASSVEIEAIRYIRTQENPQNNIGDKSAEFVVGLGAHEGGYSSLMKILPKLSSDTSACYIAVLYEYPENVDAFVNYLQRYCSIKVARAVDGAPLKAGYCYITAGVDYVTLQPLGGEIALHVHPAPFDSQKGSINRLLFSVADIMTDRSMGIVLTGSGDDGFEGIDEISRMGGKTLIQEPSTCLVDEMPSNALNRCQVDDVAPDHEIAQRLNDLFS